ncbi:hypothetical protein BGX28_004255 [Mortierella sp. GBA30]|nr:hypothetical protein BGX28_004255 [Mortierella sp. GBA30]
MTISEQSASVIDDTLRTGKEYVFQWSQDEETGVTTTMNALDSFLSQFEPSLSYEGTDKRTVWRKSCWFASPGLHKPLLSTREDVERFDGDIHDGLVGLEALKNKNVRSAVEWIKNLLDDSLEVTAKAVGLQDDMIARCTVRYRTMKYVAHSGNPGGIGLHPDGNLLSSLITNGPGLKVFDLDGTLRTPGWQGTILMGGSTLYRWSGGRYPPTFHDVHVEEGQTKVSIVAFFNFPDMEYIPRSLIVSRQKEESEDERWFHDIKKIKEDDKSPQGELSKLWTVILKNHRIVLPA